MLTLASQFLYRGFPPADTHATPATIADPYCRLTAPEQRVALYLSHVFWQGRRRLELSQEELGHLAGLSRQTVNRALKSLEQRGLVSLEFGRVTMRDGSALAAYAIRLQA